MINWRICCIRFDEVLNELGEPGVTDNQERFQKLMKEQSDCSDRRRLQGIQGE